MDFFRVLVFGVSGPFSSSNTMLSSDSLELHGVEFFEDVGFLDRFSLDLGSVVDLESDETLWLFERDCVWEGWDVGEGRDKEKGLGGLIAESCRVCCILEDGFVGEGRFEVLVEEDRLRVGCVR